MAVAFVAAYASTYASHEDAFPAAAFRPGRVLAYSRRAEGNVNRRNTASAVMLLLAAAALLAGGCGGKSISDRDLVLLDPQEGMELVEGRKKLLGLAGTENGAWVDPRSARKYRDLSDFDRLSLINEA